MIKFKCPACDKEIVVPDEQAGQTVTCSCANVNVVPAPPSAETAPSAAPAPQAAASGSEEPAAVIYQGKPSQLENLWIFLGLVVVVVLCLWPVHNLLSGIFKESSWDWGIALLLILAYVLWLAVKVLKLKCITYTVTTDNILIEQGVLLKKVDNIELFRVTDVNMSRSIFQRLLGVGNILIESSDRSMPSATLRNIPEPRAAFEKVRKASVDADVKRGVMQIEH